MSCMLFRNPSEPLLPFCHDLAGCVSVLGSIISYGLIKTLDIIEIPPHSLWSEAIVFWLVPTPPVPGQSSGLRFFSLCSCDFWSTDRTVTFLTPSAAIQYNNTRIQIDKTLSSLSVSRAARPAVPAFTVLWLLSLLTLSFAGRLYKGHCLCIFINNRAPLTPQLDNENHRLGRSGETFLVSANVAAWWHINVIYQRVYVAGLVGHFYAPLEQGCCVSA